MWSNTGYKMNMHLQNYNNEPHTWDLCIINEDYCPDVQNEYEKERGKVLCV